MITKLGDAIISLRMAEHNLKILKMIGVDKVKPEIYEWQVEIVEKARRIVEDIKKGNINIPIEGGSASL